jgi:hypothetical protein
MADCGDCTITPGYVLDVEHAPLDTNARQLEASRTRCPMAYNERTLLIDGPRHDTRLAV